ILFTNGFPNPDVQKLLSYLDSGLPHSTPFYHWGDTDVDGLRILNFIGTLTPSHAISSHLMSRKTWQPARLLNDQEIGKANQLRSNNVSISKLLDQLLIEGLPKDFEQENVDPASPLPATTDN
ncbi:MAG: hypothetical protein KGJ19_09860, partial [Betaproteobacteria bacterium]|nr:hypothetical protein [Betaproteobacteria bacterium]